MKLERPLHKMLPGAVVAQYRTLGGKTYGPYWVRVWRSGGRVRKAYVKPGELDAVREACAVNRERRAKRAASRREIRRSLSDFSLMCRLLLRVERDGESAMASPREMERLMAALERRAEG